jgi:branched-chain amino acid transport system substrate-binding protein
VSVNRRTLLQLGAGVATTNSLGLFNIAHAQDAQTITVGGSVPFSGNAADTGQNVYQGYVVAIKYINEVMGGFKVGNQTYKLKLDMIDDASDPQRAVTLIQRQIDAGTDFYLGSFSSPIVLPTAAVTERARKPMVQAGGGADQIFTRHYRYVFGMYPRASRQLWSLVTMLQSMKPEVSNVSIVLTNDSFGIAQAAGLTERLQTSGLPIVGTYRLPATVTDVTGVLAEIRANPADALVVITHEEISQLVVQQMVSTGTNAKLLYFPLGPENAAFRKSLGHYTDELLLQTYWDPRMKYSDPVFGSTGKYYEYYSANSTRAWSSQTAAASACIVCLVQAMQDAGSLDTAKVRDALAALNISTVYGPIKFTPDGDGDPVVMGPKVGQVMKGEPEIIYPAEAATAKLKYPMTPWADRA